VPKVAHATPTSTSSSLALGYDAARVGGSELSVEHARESARVVNAIQPRFVSTLVVTPVEGTPLWDQAQAGGVRGQRGPGQDFQDFQLDFLRSQEDEAPQVVRDMLQCLPGEAGNQVQVDTEGGDSAKDSGILQDEFGIASPRDGTRRGGGQGLDAYLDVEPAGRRGAQCLLEGRRKDFRTPFEMEAHVRKLGTEDFEQCDGPGRIDIERAVEQADFPDAVFVTGAEFFADAVE